jgi:deoxycytidylate deaminase
MKVYKVYCIKDRLNNSILYVGLTRQDLRTRFFQNCSRFKKNIKDYYIELISENLTILEAATLEKMLISQYDLINVGWNTSPGSINGSSNYHSDAQKEKWRQARRGKPVSVKHAEKNRTARLGKKNSSEHTRKIVNAINKAVLCVETGEVFKSGREAAKKLNLKASKISNVCHGKRRTTGGYTFKFV